MKIAKTLLLAFACMAGIHLAAQGGTTPAPAAQPKPVKVGYTNVELLLNYMPETKAIEKEIQALENKLLASLEIKQKNYQMELDELVQKVEGNLLSPEAQKAEEARILKLQQEIQMDVQKADGQVMDRRMQLLEPLQTKIQNAIDAVAKEGSYTYILNQVMGSGVPTIIYGAENTDVTDAVAKKLGIVIPEAPANKE